MKLEPSDLIEEDEDTWVSSDIIVHTSRPPVSLAIFSDEGKPSISVIESICSMLGNIDDLISKASELILDNYSKEHFHKLGVSEDRLAEDTPESVASMITLESIYIFSPETSGFELSFSAPWDDHHSFDVEFEGGNAITCAVNG